MKFICLVFLFKCIMAWYYLYIFLWFFAILAVLNLTHPKHAGKPMVPQVGMDDMRGTCWLVAQIYEKSTLFFLRIRWLWWSNKNTINYKVLLVGSLILHFFAGITGSLCLRHRGTPMGSYPEMWKTPWFSFGRKWMVAGNRPPPGLRRHATSAMACEWRFGTCFCSSLNGWFPGESCLLLFKLNKFEHVCSHSNWVWFSGKPCLVFMGKYCPCWGMVHLFMAPLHLIRSWQSMCTHMHL